MLMKKNCCFAENMYLARKMFDQALKEFETAYKLAPDNIMVLFEFGNYYQIMSEFKKKSKLLTLKSRRVQWLITGQNTTNEKNITYCARTVGLHCHLCAIRCSGVHS